MKTSKIFVFAVTCTIIGASAFMAGCTGEESTIEEPELTEGYLSGDYAAQLIRDGAETAFGTISLTVDEDGTVWVDVSEKEYVEDAGQPAGYYIADKNLESRYQLSSEARATYLAGGSSIVQVMDADEFADAVLSLEEEAIDKESLYYIYAMGDQVQLLIARYLP